MKNFIYDIIDLTVIGVFILLPILCIYYTPKNCITKFPIVSKQIRIEGKDTQYFFKVNNKYYLTHKELYYSELDSFDTQRSIQ